LNWGPLEVDAIQEASKFWQERRNEALAFMASRSHHRSALLEISAQHPLDSGVTPNREFRARLDMGFCLFHELSRQELAVQIYVPGSRHKHDDVEDVVSLSHAGCAYLREKGVPSDVMHGDDLNDRYKGEAGVYGSADEAYVASAFFREEKFGQLVSVMSPGQLMRKSLHYLAFGVYPMSYAIPSNPAFHDYVHEALNSVPHTLFVDRDLQARGSAEAARLRSLRLPDQKDVGDKHGNQAQ
jgi:hypothetical protein